MDHKPLTLFRNAMKLFFDFLVGIILIAIFAVTVLGMAKDNAPVGMAWLSGLTCLLVVFLVYTDMHTLATKEKRPQYNLNPTVATGVMYGFMGMVPVWILQLISVLIPFPDALATVQRRILQTLTGPFYWLARLLGNGTVMYFLVLLVVVLIAVLGYWAGLHDFQLMPRIYKLVGYTPKKKKRPTGKKPPAGKGFFKF